MATENQPAQAVAWHELNTSDAEAAKPFYEAVLGWGVEAMPMPGDASVGNYTMFTRDGKPFCGISPMTTAETGAPPHWAVFFSVPNTDTAVAKTLELGGKVIVPAFEVPTIGRMSLVQDPQGAHFWLFQEAPKN
jgi:predicted enzyme related to lactoylglutathione lyase